MAIKTPSEYRNMEFVNLMKELSRLYKPYRYVEIGVKNGYTFNRMISDPWIEDAIAVDINPDWLRNDITPKTTGPAALGEVVASDGVLKCCMTSDDFAYQYPDMKRPDYWIDFLFIDGDHKYESVRKDFENLSKFVRPFTGLIFLHDTYPVKKELAVEGYCYNAWKAAWYISRYAKTKYNCEIVTLPGPWAGLSIIRMLKKTEHMHWQKSSIKLTCLLSHMLCMMMIQKQQ
jgi:hypothetical protein